ncbi:hypothetical protein SDC9_121559 [bioreactor metagenome]|jgi:hypothetical protein|uniref:Uncharacterized protein n=1 Tax=bioreactor metagenome TaxID=1076179 RepID=A0A645CCC2_9ZZZZ
MGQALRRGMFGAVRLALQPAQDFLVEAIYIVKGTRAKKVVFYVSYHVLNPAFALGIGLAAELNADTTFIPVATKIISQEIIAKVLTFQKH